MFYRLQRSVRQISDFEELLKNGFVCWLVSLIVDKNKNRYNPLE